MEKKMTLPNTELKPIREQAIRELNDIELDNVSGGSLMWGAIVEPTPVP